MAVPRLLRFVADNTLELKLSDASVSVSQIFNFTKQHFSQVNDMLLCIAGCREDGGRWRAKELRRSLEGRVQEQNHRQLRVSGANVGSECVTSLSVRSD